jgi:hypothetical protein
VSLQYDPSYILPLSRGEDCHAIARNDNIGFVIREIESIAPKNPPARTFKVFRTLKVIYSDTLSVSLRERPLFTPLDK